ncbi:MAG: VOC family protein [Clostridia bacterium]|nr:VOC family protein [Clostridia bacterium]
MKPESSIIFFPCKNMEETLAYYTEVVGLPVHKNLGKSVWLDCGYGYLGFVEYDPPRPMASGACISLNLESTEAVDAMYAMLKTKPVLGLQAPPQKHPKFPVYSFFFSDPNGYLLEFQKPLDT